MKLTDESKAIMVIDKRHSRNEHDAHLHTSLIVDKQFVRDTLIHSITTTLEVGRPSEMKITTVQHDEDINEMVYHDRYVANYEIIEAYSWKDIMEALRR